MLTALTISLLAAALPLVQAQTSTSCNPLHSKCPSDPSLPAAFDSDLAGVSSLPSGWATTAGSVTFDPLGAKFVVGKQGDAPTIQTTGYFFFGYAEVKMKAAYGQGIVSSIVLESDDLDEIDWEFTGTDTTQTQTNYFGKGDTTTYDRAIWYPVSSPQTTFHTYAVNWTSSQITWLVDGVAVRTLNYADAQGGARFPQTPMRLRLGVWAGGDPTNGDGTIEWSGGPTDYSKGPFTMYVESVNIVNYSPASSYSFGDSSGSWNSIQTTGGNAGGSGGGGSGSKAGSSNISPSVVSGSAAIQISTASAPISSSTSGGVTSSAILTKIPLLSSTTESIASPTSGITTSTVPVNSTSASKGGSSPLSASITSSSVTPSSDAPINSNIRSKILAAMIFVAALMFVL